MSATSPIQQPPRLGWPTKALYGLSAMNQAVRGTISGFTLIFYSQIVGLDPRAVSLATGIALLIDAFWDPIVGQISDNTRSRVGRRHLFIYIATVPAALLFVALYTPPMSWSDNGIFFYLLVVLILGRMFESLVEIPMAALLPELSRDYDQRTSLASWRYVFTAVIGRLLSLLLTLGVFLRGTKAQPYGQLNAAGYAPAAITFAVIGVVALIASARATQRFVPYMHVAPPKRPGFRDMLREIWIALGNRNFFSLALSGFIFGIAVGITGGLQTYFLTYYWELPSSALLGLGVLAIPGGLIGVILAPYVSKALGKKRACLITFFMSIFTVTIPIGARLAGVMPPNHSPWVFIILAIDSFATGLLSITGFVIVTGMLADVVEEAQAKSGKRSEGVLFAADSLLRKVTSSFASVVPGQIIAYVGLTRDAKPGHVDPAILTQMATIYLPVVTVLYLCSTSSIFLYRIDRQRHEDNLDRIAEAAALADESGADLSVGVMPGP